MTTKRKALDLAALRRLAEAATPGPWEWRKDLDAIVGPCPVVYAVNVGDDPRPYLGGMRPDFDYICAVSPNVVTALLDRLAELEDRLRVSEEQNAALGDANELSVECSRLRALASEACDIGERLHQRLQVVSSVDYGGALARLSTIRTSLKKDGEK